MKKKCKVVMLSTEKASVFGYIHESQTLHIYTDGENPHNLYDNLAEPRHLYLISDDEIKEGDWYFNIGMRTRECGVIQADKRLAELATNALSCKKIIATTDPDLKLKDFPELDNSAERKLPQFSEDFIKAYVKAYNEGSPIEEVLVEHELITTKTGTSVIGKLPHGEVTKIGNYNQEKKPKLRDDNTVIISQAKITYSREEVENLLNIYGNLVADKTSPDDLTKWIEDNL